MLIFCCCISVQEHSGQHPYTDIHVDRVNFFVNDKFVMLLKVSLCLVFFLHDRLGSTAL